jgi:hypothetical protein
MRVLVLDFDGFITLLHTYELHRDENHQFTRNLSTEQIEKNLRNPEFLKKILSLAKQSGFIIVIASFHEDPILIDSYLNIANFTEVDLIFAANNIPDFNLQEATNSETGYWKDKHLDFICNYLNEKYNLHLTYSDMIVADDTKQVTDNAKKLGCEIVYAKSGDNSYLMEMLSLIRKEQQQSVENFKNSTINPQTMPNPKTTQSGILEMLANLSVEQNPNPSNVQQTTTTFVKSQSHIDYHQNTLLNYFKIIFDADKNLIRLQRDNSDKNRGEVIVLEKFLNQIPKAPKLIHRPYGDGNGTYESFVYLNQAAFNTLNFLLTGQAKNAFDELKPKTTNQQPFPKVQFPQFEKKLPTQQSFSSAQPNKLNTTSNPSLVVSKPKAVEKTVDSYIDDLVKWLKPFRQYLPSDFTNQYVEIVDLLHAIDNNDDDNKDKKQAMKELLNTLDDVIAKRSYTNNPQINFSSLTTILHYFKNYLETTSHSSGFKR